MNDYFLFLGTGTSYGIPQLGCRCSVCTSEHARNRRSRCSGLLRTRGVSLLIDATPDFRTQALREGVDHVDGVFITHVHADHVFGLDDLRPLSLQGDSPIPIFADRESADQLRQIFEYIFCTEKRRPGVPWLVLREIEGGRPFTLGGAEFLPLPVEHGRWPCFGLRHGDFAYITDAKVVPPATRELLQGVEVLCLDLLREEPHPTHMSRGESLGVVRDLGCPRTWFIHMGHEIDHEPFDLALPSHCSLAWDGHRIGLRTCS